jgi:membrane associated rhomboid family serine protease
VQEREPLFNVPSIVVVAVALLALIHAVRTLILTQQQDLEFLLTFAFIPARYNSSMVLGGVLPGGAAAEVWTFVTYSLIHADWTHLSINAIWLLPFGSAVARRFGTWRFVVFLVVTAAIGAAAHLATHPRDIAPMIGASAAISGTMAAAMRFAFQRGGPLSFRRTGGDVDYQVPALPLSGVFRDPAVLGFLAVWFAINFLFGLWSLPIGGENQVVAWQAHIGGFLAGLLLFSWFDPRRQVTQFDDFGATRH